MRYEAMATGVAQSIIDKQKWIDDLADLIQPIINQAYSGAGEAGHMVKDLLNGVWLGHPLHPMLTDVPIGAWTMTELLDFVSAAMGDDPGLDRASDITLAAGLLATAPTILSGLTDWSDIGGAQRRLGLAHALINTGSLVLYLGSLGLRAGGTGRSRGLARLLSASAYVVNATAAYIGGELVYSLGQAVNRDAWVEGPEKYADVAAEADLQDGKMQKFDVEGEPVVLLKHEDGLHAFNGRCPHFGCGLWEGELDGHVVTCPCHGSQFDVSNGQLLHGPATASVPSYDVRRKDGRIEVRVRKKG
jgi:nitrite reductase/ring-hydroxylating ferredoxin subunit/uncharacterized membrane protein